MHGGGAAWLVGSYDPKTNTVFWGTSNPGPWNSAVRSTGDGNMGKLTNLYTASTVAFDAELRQDQVVGAANPGGRLGLRRRQ